MLGLPMNLFPLRKQNTYLHRKLHIQGDARFTLNALDTAAPPNGAKQGSFISSYGQSALQHG